jgi:hypothetical protein
VPSIIEQDVARFIRGAADDKNLHVAFGVVAYIGADDQRVARGDFDTFPVQDDGAGSLQDVVDLLQLLVLVLA